YGVLDQLSLSDGRATGLRNHPLTFAESLLFPLAYLMSLLARPGKIAWGKWVPSMGVLIIGLLLSQSRGPWIGFAVMTLALVALAPRPHVWKRLGALALFPLALVLAVPTLRHRALSIGDTGFLSNTERLI